MARIRSSPFSKNPSTLEADTKWLPRDKEAEREGLLVVGLSERDGTIFLRTNRCSPLSFPATAGRLKKAKTDYKKNENTTLPVQLQTAAAGHGGALIS